MRTRQQEEESDTDRLLGPTHPHTMYVPVLKNLYYTDQLGSAFYVTGTIVNSAVSNYFKKKQRKGSKT